MHDATAAFLARIGVSAGWSCLDVGCGDGQARIHQVSGKRPVAPGSATKQQRA